MHNSDFLDACWEVAKITTSKINSMEDAIAIEWFGCKHDMLDYDSKELVTWEAYDRLMEEK